MRRALTTCVAVLLLSCSAVAATGDMMVQIPPGAYVPFYARESVRGAARPRTPVAVAGFALDRSPVTNREFLDFVRKHPQWSRSRIPSLFADGHYLQSWASDFSLHSGEDADRPVTNVSWFAAQGFCRAQGKTLPTTDQWEYALADNGRDTAVKDRILAWYATPNAAIPGVSKAHQNGFGVRGLVGYVWEWTLDFNSLMSGADLRGGNSRFCGGASLGAADASDYASFMRYSLRASLKASYTTNNLGFRCASSS